jgi:hypothetical protein
MIILLKYHGPVKRVKQPAIQVGFDPDLADGEVGVSLISLVQNCVYGWGYVMGYKAVDYIEIHDLFCIV